MPIVLFDAHCRADLYPLTYTKAVVDLRVGIYTIKERWQHLLQQDVFVSTAAYLQQLYQQVPHGLHYWIDASVLPTNSLVEQIKQLQQGEALCNETGLIATLVDAVTFDVVANCITTTKTIEKVKRLNHPFEIFMVNGDLIKHDFLFATANKTSQQLSETNRVLHHENVFVEAGASIEHAIINASEGPVYIGPNTTIMEGCFIRGPFVMHEGSVLKMGTKVYGTTTLGPHCVAGGEIKNVVMQGYSNKAHDGYLGDSVIGEWCNFGAGTSNSNIKNTASPVKAWRMHDNSFINAGIKCGAVVGDYTRFAINSAINTGSVVGICCNIFGAGLLPKTIPNFSWGVQGEGYVLEKCLRDIHNWKQLKHQSLTTAEAEVLKHIFEAAIAS